MMSGPTIILSPQAAQNFALALHELATNAAKHGALSVPAGRVIIEWGVDPPSADAANGAGGFLFHWQERDGPPVAKPQRKGFGSTVLERVMAQYAEPEPEVDFARGGLSYRVTGRLDAIVANLHPLDAPLSGLPASQGRTP
jgi:two-component sensor histidine kinase